MIKKIVFFMMSVLFLTSIECAQGQGMVNVTLKAGNIWGDGSGYQLLLDSTATAYGTVIPAKGVFYDNCNAPATLYDAFHYKIPVDADPVCTTDNIVMDNSITIQIPAGTYDWCLVNPQPGALFWIPTGENGRKDNYVFEEGKKYLLEPIRPAGADAFVIITVEKDVNPNAPVAVTNLTSTLTNGTVTLSWTNPTTTAEGAPLSSLTSVTVFYNDGVTPIYTNSNPTVGGSDGCTYTISGVIGNTFTVVARNSVGNGEEASTFVVYCTTVTSLPFTEDFETSTVDCWTKIDADGDGYFWEMSSLYAPHNGIRCAISKSVVNRTEGLHPDNYMVTPRIAIPSTGNTTLKFWIASHDPNFPVEHYSLKISTTDLTPDSFTQILEETLSDDDTWFERTVPLNNYAGQEIYIAFVHNESTNQHALKLDDVSITNDGAGTIIPAFNGNKDGVLIYPNPSNGLVNIKAAENSTVQIFDVTGRIIGTHHIEANSTLTLNQPAGLYFIRMDCNGKTSTHKIVIN